MNENCIHQPREPPFKSTHFHRASPSFDSDSLAFRALSLKNRFRQNLLITYDISIQTVFSFYKHITDYKFWFKNIKFHSTSSTLLFSTNSLLRPLRLIHAYNELAGRIKKKKTNKYMMLVFLRHAEINTDWILSTWNQPMFMMVHKMNFLSNFFFFIVTSTIYEYTVELDFQVKGVSYQNEAKEEKKY